MQTRRPTKWINRRWWLPVTALSLLAPHVASAQAPPSGAEGYVNIHPLSALDDSAATGGILIDKVVGRHDYGRAKDPSTPLSLSTWCRLYDGLASADNGSAPPQDEDGEPIECAPQVLASVARNDGLNTIALIDYEFSRISDTAFEDGFLVMGDDGLVQETVGAAGAGFVDDSLLAAAVVSGDIVSYAGYTSFIVDNDTIFANHGAAIPTAIEIDFDDGLGYRYVNVGSVVTVSYADERVRNIKVRVERGGVTSESTARAAETQAARSDVPDPTHDYPIDRPGTGYDVHIWEYHSEDGEFDKPIIIPDGFDPVDQERNTWADFWDLLNHQDLIEDLVERGYDIVVVNFDKGAGDIEKNAEAFSEVVEAVNRRVTRTDSIVVVGPSMGGVVARYSLAQMEADGTDHNVRLFVSFDAPQRGANIPIGVQNAVLFNDYFGWPLPMDVGLIALGQIASRQMLLAQLATENDMERFYDDLRELGYPDTRLVAIANGSGNGVDQGYAPGAELVSHDFSGPVGASSAWGPICLNPTNILTIDWTARAVQADANLSNGAFGGQTWCLPALVPRRAWAIANDGDDTPWDSTPGSTRRTQYQLFREVDERPSNKDKKMGWWPGWKMGLPVVHHEHHSFIPTISALDIPLPPTTNIHAFGPAIPGLTPFDEVYYAMDRNEPHLEINSKNACWLLNEIDGDGTPVCRPPLSGDWTIDEDCIVVKDIDFDGDIRIEDGVSVTVQCNSKLSFDFGEHQLRIGTGGARLFIEDGSRLTSL